MSRLFALLVVLAASACTPAMQDAWRATSPAERDARGGLWRVVLTPEQWATYHRETM